ncbi:MAG TPA: ATP-binding cassette domain-containing protein [Candidatus Dormibacteraeota bacterium]|nr:ATP-binding cassette domain-containing protein [Candidatus Dormibacteraeota bacterium]
MIPNRTALGKATDAVVVENLRKSFPVKGGTLEAVRGIDLRVARGEIFGFLGPNGAGKTTTLRMLTTLLPPDGGRALVAGADVASRPQDVRRRIGYVGQRGGADSAATGRENLVLQARLYGQRKAEASARAAELIDLVELSEFADRPVLTYSGGQRRRLEVALGIVHHPQVLFLDEPTAGLDPQNRANLWDRVRALRATGTTVFLTTHYMEEADALCDRVAIIDHGAIASEGTPRELKQCLGREMVLIKPGPAARPLEDLRRDLAAERFVEEARIEGETIRLAVGDGGQALPAIVARLQSDGVPLETISLSAPSLDDVFLRQTGRSLRDAGKGEQS